MKMCIWLNVLNETKEQQHVSCSEARAWVSLELVGDVACLCARAFLATTRLFNNNFLVGVDVVYVSAGELVLSREKEEEDALHHQCEQYSMSMWFTY